jgi:molybdopterin-biosynthesis enzyme MoeA-like protein
MIQDKYRVYAKQQGLKKIELTPARVKMAKLPKGAKPVPNPLGTAPGVQAKYDKVLIIALPGVPPEMEAIFKESVAPAVREFTGDVTFFEASLGISGLMESELAPIIERVMRDNSYVYIKSHPKGAEMTPQIELHLSTRANDSTTARNRVSRAIIQVTNNIEAKGGKTTRLKTKK